MIGHSFPRFTPFNVSLGEIIKYKTLLSSSGTRPTHHINFIFSILELSSLFIHLELA